MSKKPETRIEIRRMAFANADAWAELRHCLWPSASVADHREELAAELAERSLRGYMACDAGEAVGFAEVSVRPYANGYAQRPVPFLEGIWIRESHRRSGIGRYLIAVIAEDLRGQGFGELCSDAELDNHVSHAAHAGWGFEETKRVVYFRKPL